ncbi:Crp/Fnr family transcriptional regulator [Staphylococcus sp. GDY8P57P]|uniref:Crp/Fnr family transcriptional regulator n=1 Tax=Staphylococcus sp. GDY8P57P TaxID=2804128 RepID=UPI00187F940A|nr:Crp/Fnr family transcriptional regulator [Staphylococcus sp. GDY8P57P]MBF2756364.1 Crp/Fnr family transcriptional regulator [Staphylococcus haemolyticus]MBF2773611.1 Crp/Fnr family transcriptional regulator [Staphylococcus haemolyticus]MBF2775728.1 Crp/Fnr family transcriptional regulator [Staphylococcus haemolyticus]MBF2816667.1 Crp/Fnr family transcriptional regulator [Staphylococcus haemolyticus]MBF9719930.1 Crp/Fnr family transcriptional regulator [Staphylococcus haemolyticus]
MEQNQCCHHQHGHAECIRIVPIFNHLKDSQMDLIAESAKTLHLQKGEMLFRADEEDDTLYIINSGKARIYRLSDSGKEQLVRILNPGDFTGEVAIFQPGSIHENYAEALQNTSICLIKREDLQEYLVKYPQISLKILSEVTMRLKDSEKQTTQVAIENVETRIISFLAENVEKGSGNSPTIILPMSKKDLASYLGTTPETISRKFTNLEELGLIKQLPKKKIKIMDLDQLLLHTE